MSKRQNSRILRYVLAGHWFSCDIPICSEVKCPFFAAWIVRIVNCPYCKIEVSQLKLPEHIARLGGGKKTGMLNSEIPETCAIYGWFMADLWMVSGWFMDDLGMIYIYVFFNDYDYYNDYLRVFKRNIWDLDAHVSSQHSHHPVGVSSWPWHVSDFHGICGLQSEDLGEQP